MAVEIIGVFIPIILSIGLFITIIYIRRYQNKERMLIIEKGMDPEIFQKTNRVANFSPTLRTSLLLIGIGVGFLFGYFLETSTRMEEIAYLCSLFICGGVGLGIAYIIEEKKNKQS